MMNSNILPALVLLPAWLLVGSIAAHPALAAPKILFDPSAKTVAQDATTVIDVTVDVESQSAFGADAVIRYGTSDVEVASVANGGFFSDFSYANDPGAGRLELHGFFSSLYENKSGSGRFATVTFKAKKNSGTGSLSFTCTGSGADTQILNSSGNNILTCGNVNQASLTFTGQEIQPTATHTPQPGAPSATPGSTNTTPTCTAFTSSPTTIYTGTTVTFSCTGVDPGGDITAVDFAFGNNASKLVSQNVGSTGTLTTTYSYPTAGTYTPSCRVRDNNNVFSTPTNTCRRTINVLSRGGTVPSKTPTQRPPNAAPTSVATQATPTLAVITLAPYQSPTPFPTIADPTVAPQEPQEGTPLWRYLIAALIALTTIGILIYIFGIKKEDPPKPPPLVHD